MSLCSNELKRSARAQRHEHTNPHKAVVAGSNPTGGSDESCRPRSSTVEHRKSQLTRLARADRFKSFEDDGREETLPTAAGPDGRSLQTISNRASRERRAGSNPAGPTDDLSTRARGGIGRRARTFQRFWNSCGRGRGGFQAGKGSAWSPAR